MFQQRKPGSPAEGTEAEVLPVPAPLAPAPPPQPTPLLLPDGAPQEYLGTLGQAALRLTLLRSGGVVTGTGRLAGRADTLRLQGQLMQGGTTLNVQATDARGKQVGHFLLNARGMQLHGVWHPAGQGQGVAGVHLKPGGPTPAPQSASVPGQLQGPPPAQAAPTRPRASRKPASKPAGKPGAAAPAALHLSGKLGRHSIVLSLTIRGQEVSGEYSSKRGVGTPFKLSGTLGVGGELTLKGGGETFVGLLSADGQSFSGTWSAEGKTLKVTLQAAASGPEPEPERPRAPAKQSKK